MGLAESAAQTGELCVSAHGWKLVRDCGLFATDTLATDDEPVHVMWAQAQETTGSKHPSALATLDEAKKISDPLPAAARGGGGGTNNMNNINNIHRKTLFSQNFTNTFSHNLHSYRHEEALLGHVHNPLVTPQWVGTELERYVLAGVYYNIIRVRIHCINLYNLCIIMACHKIPLINSHLSPIILGTCLARYVLTCNKSTF